MYDQYVLFYGGPFSQWCPSNFHDEHDVYYDCAEQYMMEKKALFFDDVEMATKIMNTPNPAVQKMLGKKVSNFDVNKWNTVARRIVYKGNYFKFVHNSELFHELMNTKGKLLVEASPTDKIWGIGLSEYNPDAQIRDKWDGTNWLGEILTNLRDDFLYMKQFDRYEQVDV